MSEETRARILRIADELNWRPHSVARALGGARADTVGLVIARPARTLGVEPFFGQLLSGLQARLSADSIALQLLIVEDVGAEIEIYRRWASEQRVDGLVLVDLQTRDPRLAVVEELGMPAVVVGGPAKTGSLCSVWADDRAAMMTLVDYLAALGHTRIAHVAGKPEFRHTQRRARALRDAAGRLGLAQAVSLHTDFSDTEGARTTRTLLSSKQRPTAIIYDSDLMAVAGLGVAMEMGVAVPGGLSIASFDDSVLTRLTHPAITALSRDTYAFGMRAASALLDVMADPNAPRDIQTDTPSLTVRESTALLATVPKSV